MIRVNLLKNIGVASAPSANTLPRASESLGASGTIYQAGLTRLLGLLAPTLILFSIEKYNISILTRELENTNVQIAKVETEIRKFGDTGPRLERYIQIKAKLEKQFDALQTISSNRLREVKTLDSLQTIIPARNWISELSIDEMGKVLIQGFSETPDGAFSFVKAIEENPNFSEVSKVNVSSDESQNTGAKTSETFKKYSFEFRIGKPK